MIKHNPADLSILKLHHLRKTEQYFQIILPIEMIINYREGFFHQPFFYHLFIE